MRTFATFFACAPVALAAAIVPRAGSVPDGPWTAGVWRQPIDDDVFFTGNAINASGGKFWVNKDTSAYCPDGIEGLDCTLYPGSRTVFAGGNNTVSLDVSVPGGQQVYVAPDGSLSYTTAHSAFMPNGSIVTGFSRSRSEAFGAPIYWGMDGRSWLICPVGEGEPREKTYQLFILAGNQKEDCLLTGVRTYTSSGPDAWQYA
ncbi:hypothetical protein F4820DRAFT_427303 [Hypoxylon rubiginosum]|uniref:Uncharacterized protein n=1 Tax=Hypoxylon rubiginosum TaxID=110542 RepID=A0ACB9YVT1_9PEZI|nr:hypothetical protein F4820DRAFT_427303 [Hypoxylon rubiginosum]